MAEPDTDLAHELVEMARLALTGSPQDPVMYAGRLCHKYRDRSPALSRRLAEVLADAGAEFSPLRDAR